MITPDTLLKFIEDNSVDKIRTTLKSMSEQQRLALSSEALRAASLFHNRAVQAQATLYRNCTPEQISAYFEEESNPLREAVLKFEATKIAVLYCCDFKDLRIAGENGLPAHNDCLLVLRDRNPKWLKKWCTYALRNWPWQVWQTVYALDDQFLQDVKYDAKYYTAMVLGMPAMADMQAIVEKSPSLRDEFYAFLSSTEAIRAMASPAVVTREMWMSQFRRAFTRAASDPSSLRDGSFQMPSSAVGTPYIQRISERWIECICKLAESEIIDRRRVIDISFQNLLTYAESQQKRKSYLPEENLGTFLCSLNSGLCTDKKPFLSKYAMLTGATNKAISEYASKILIAVPGEDLPIEDVLSGIRMVFRNRDKQPAVLAIHLLSKISKLSAAPRESLGLTVIEAFNHRSKAIHKDALSLLQSADLCNINAVRMKLQQALDQLQGENRLFASELISKSGPRTEQLTHKQNLSQAAVVSNKAKPFKLPDEFNKEWMALVGLPVLLTNTEQASPAELLEAVLAPVDLTSMNSPRLSEADLISPIESIDDLIYLASAALAGPLTSEKTELLLDGIARLGTERPPQFEEKVTGLRAKIDGLIAPGYALGGMPVAIVIKMWLEGTNFDTNWIYFRPRIFEARCTGIAARLWAGTALPLLAAPTNRAGWIDPAVLVRRVKTYQANERLLSCSGENWPWAEHRDFVAWLSASSANKFAVDAPEFIQALLRLAPDGRSAALNEAQSISGDFGKALRFALGEGEIDAIERSELAIAAFRSRFPGEVCAGVSATIVENMPDGIYPAKYTFVESAVEESYANHFRIISTMLPDFLTVQGLTPVFPMADREELNRATCDPLDEVNTELLNYLLYPTVALHSNVRHYCVLEDFSTIWLQNKEPLLARLAKEVLLNINSTASGWQNDFTIFFDPDFPLHENGSWWLALALAAKQDQLRRLAIDVLIAAVDENRVDATKLAISMSLLSKVTQVRWIDAIRELARVSALHSIFTWKLLNSFLINKRERTPLAFLEVILELRETYGFGLDSDAVEILQLFQGSGKAAKIARQLVSTGSNWENVAALHEAIEQSLKSRKERLVRWQRTKYYGNYHPTCSRSDSNNPSSTRGVE